MSASKILLVHLIVLIAAMVYVYNGQSFNLAKFFKSLPIPAGYFGSSGGGSPKDVSTKRKRSDATDMTEQRKMEEIALKMSPQLVGNMTHPESGEHYLIVDYKYRTHQNGPIAAIRMIEFEKLRGFTLSMVELEVPKKFTKANTDSSKWPVNKLVVPSGYIQLHIAAPFFMEAMTLENPPGVQKALIIGLGGGTNSNFLAQLDWLNIETTVVDIDPFVLEIANRYFNHATNERTKVIIEDGIKYLEESARKGRKYHSISLDACHNTKEFDILCPLEIFAEKRTVQNIYDSLEDGGVLSINTISVSGDPKTFDAIRDKFAEIFPSCSSLRYDAAHASDSRSAKTFVVCAKRENWTYEEQKERFRKNMGEVDDTFEFKLVRSVL